MMKAETQTFKESKNKKFTFPRHSLTYESVSEQTDKYIRKQYILWTSTYLFYRFLK
jgi:hypothetical protein